MIRKMIGAVLALSTSTYAHIVPFPSANVPVETTSGSIAVFTMNANDAVQVTIHTPFPFELSLSIACIGTAEITPGNIPLRSEIDGSLTFTSADHPVWCVGTPQHCTPPYNGIGYYGIKFQLADGTHYGWLKTSFTNDGFGNVDLYIARGYYQDVPDHEIQAGVIETTHLPECESVDFNCDGDVGTDLDIEAFFACIAGSCPAAPCGNTADFDGDGDTGTDLDIEAFFRVLGGGAC